jgi:hypothetical protein
MEIRWLVSVAASSFHAAGAMLRGHPLVDAPLAEKLAAPVDQIRAIAESFGIDPILLVEHLAATSVESTSLEEQARVAIRKTVGDVNVSGLSAAVTAWIRQIQSIFLQVHSNALDELELRSKPLREQWEARGPGLIARLGLWIGSESIAELADVILVQPVLGGGGTAHVPYNRVSFEAVLANSEAELPEVVRLGWLLSQLQLDLPAIQGQLSRQRTLAVGSLALLPATLAAAHDVELTAPPDTALAMALEAWRLPHVHAETLLAWWETYLDTRPSWSMSLAALDQLLVSGV